MDTQISRRPQGSAGNRPARPHVTEEERRRIQDRTLDIVTARLGAPTVKARTYWRWGNKAGLKVNFAGPLAGTFYDFDGEVHGDMIAWIRREYGCGFPEAKEIALQERAPDPVITRAKAKATTGKAVNQSAFAHQQLQSSRPVLKTLAGKYLIEYRYIPADTVHALDTDGFIRFLPRHKSKPDSVFTTPALALLASDLEGNVHGFQAVRLQPTGQKREGRAVKLSCGALRDNAAAGWLSRGDGDVILAEGPEDAITVYAARPDAMVGAALGGIKRLVLSGALPAGRRIIIAAQNDEPDSNAAKSLRQACDLLVEQGFEVLLAYPPAGIKDANDLLRARGLDAVRSMLDNALPVPPKGKADNELAEIDAAIRPEPFWPRVGQDAQAASDRLQAIVEEWMCHAERWFDAKDYEADQKEAFITEGMTLKEKRAVRRQITANVREKFPDIDLKAPMRLQVAGSASLGKSSAVREAYLKHPKLWRRQFHGFLPTLKLAAEFERDMKTLIGSSLDAPLVAMHKGRSHECLRSKSIAEKLAGNVVSSYSATCDNGEVKCQFFERCGYPASWMIQEDGMHLFAHDFLTLPKILKFPTADFAFIDEDATHSLLSIGTSLPASVLTEPMTYQTAALTDEQDDAAALGARVMAAITSGNPMLDELRKAGITRKQIKLLTAWAVPTEKKPDITPDMTDKQIEALLPLFQVHNGELAARVFVQLGRELSTDRTEANGIAYFPHNGPCATERQRQRQGMIELYRRKVVRGVPKGIPLLIIDADADLETNRIFYGDSLVSHEITAPRKGEVTQINNATLPKSSLIPEKAFEDPSAQTIETAEALRASIIAFVKSRAAGGKKVLVGVTKSFRCFVTGESDGKLPPGCDAHGATWTHYGAILGIDLWKDYDVIILIGRDQMPAEAAEEQARAIYSDQPDTLNLTGEYRKTTRHHRMRDGSTVAVDVHVHNDPRVQRRVESKRERGMCQMIDRLRLIHGKAGREIIILSNLPLPGIEVDEMTTLNKVLKDRTPQQDLSRLLDFARETWGVLPLVPKFLADHAPQEIVPSEATARRLVARLMELPINAQSLTGNYKLGIEHLSTARFWRKAINQKRPSMALFFNGRAAGTAALEALFGSIAVQGGDAPEHAEPLAPPALEASAPEAAAVIDCIQPALQQAEPGEIEEDFTPEVALRYAAIQKSAATRFWVADSAEKDEALFHLIGRVLPMPYHKPEIQPQGDVP